MMWTQIRKTFQDEKLVTGLMNMQNSIPVVLSPELADHSCLQDHRLPGI